MIRSLLLALSLVVSVTSAQEPGKSQTPKAPSEQAPATQTGEQTAVPTLLKGCLRQLGGNWVLGAENGQIINLLGENSLLKPHDGREIEVKGAQTSGGAFQVTSVTRISDSCTAGPQASRPSGEAQRLPENKSSSSFALWPVAVNPCLLTGF